MSMESISNIRDNDKRGNVYNFLKETIADNFSKENGTKSKLKIVSAYFTIYAFNALKEELTNKVSETKFILGEPSSIENLDLKNKRFKIFKIQDENINLTNVIQQNKIAKECYEWLKSSAVQIRTAPKKNNKKALIHGKMFHIEQDKNEKVVEAIIGSSNFTTNGLGIGNTSNFELNTIIDSKYTINDLNEWFKELWENNTEDAKKEILSYLETIYKENSPEQVYFKTLYHLFEERLEEDDIEEVENNKQFANTQIWNKLYRFQKDAVNSIVKKLNKYNGCILADSVGLGKTYTALGVIQYFICNKKPNILVLAPKRLANNWEIYTKNHPKNPFDLDNLDITFITHSGLTTKDIDKKIKLGNFDLVVIDESHNFRNATPSKKDENGSVLKISRYDKLLNTILKEGVRAPKVLLLSATPVNTNLTTDLNNQIKLITFDNDNAFSSSKSLEINSVEGTLKIAKKAYLEWALKDDRKKQDLLNSLNANFFKLMDALTIARSRKQIKNNYENSDIEIGKFPKRKNPIAKCIEIDTMNQFPSFKAIDEEIDKYSLSLFNPTKYLKNKEENVKDKKLAGNMTQEERENYLIGMMKSGFLKRLESSISSFTKSMKNTMDKIDDRIDLIDSYNKNQNGEIDTDFETDIEDEDLLTNLYDSNKYTVGKKLKYSLNELNVDNWKKDLINDKKQIEKIYNIAKEITADRDKKLAELKEFIIEKSKQKNKKILLFTTYADTANYIYYSLKDFVKDKLGLNIAVVTGQEISTTFGEAKFDEVLENFSPISKLEDKNRDSKCQIDILIATDCISEGQNLQDCDTVINYDIHWNPVRLIQRFGRIDRIGSLNDYIQMVCFWPTKDLDDYINLRNRVEARMAMADIAACADDNLLEKQEIDSKKKDLTYRDKQLKQIREEQSIDNIEENNALLDLSDISLEDFRNDLKDFIESRKNDLKNVPNGVCAIVPSNATNKKTSSSGIIFCLKQKVKSVENKEHNELHPYYLVYIKDNGSVLYTYENSRRILEVYKDLCLGKTEPFYELCDKFNKNIETKDGLAFYDSLLKSAIKSLTKTYATDISQSLGRRGGIIPVVDEQLKSDDDFELITWLIIDGGNN